MSKGKVVRVVTACNENEKYQACVPFFYKFWSQINQLSVNTYLPTVIQIAEAVTIPSVGRFDLPKDMSTVYVSQFIRNLAPALFSDADVCMTSDVDIVPLSARFFDNCIKQLSIPDARGNQNRFIVSRDVLPPGQFPICYNFASPSTWSNISQTGSLEAVSEVLKVEWGRVLENHKDYIGSHGGSGWFRDQEWIYERLIRCLEASTIELVLLRDHETEFRRLDRNPRMHYLRWLQLELVKTGRYSDYHLHHPVPQHRRFINAAFHAFSKSL